MKKSMKNLNQKDFMKRMNEVPYATEQEESEIMSALSKLTYDDLQVLKVDKINFEKRWSGAIY